MTVLAQWKLNAVVAPGGEWDRLQVVAGIVPPYTGFDPSVFDPDFFETTFDYGRQLTLDVTVDDSLASEVSPGAGLPQVVTPWRVFVGGVEIPARDLLPSMTVSEDRAGVVTWQFAAVRGDDGRGEILGRPTALRGVPGGTGAVEIRAGFILAGRGGVSEIPLVVEGVMDNTDADPERRTFNGGGPRERLRHVLADYQAPPGHGQTSGTIVRRILESAGLTLDGGGRGGERRYKEVSVIDEDPLAAADRILEPELRRVYVDPRTADVRIHDYGAAPEARVEGVIRDRDVWAVGGTLTEGAAADQVTKVTLTGTKQIIREPDEGGCPRRTEMQVSENFSVFAPRRAGWVQDAGGISATPDPLGPDTPSLRRESALIYFRTIACETVVFEREFELGWRNLESARYEVNSSGNVSSLKKCYFFEEPAAVAVGSPYTDDSTRAYVWIGDRWGVVQHVTRERQYDPETGALRRVVERIMADHVTQRLLKKATLPSPDWSTVSYHTVPDFWVTGDGRAIEGPTPKQERWVGDGFRPGFPYSMGGEPVWSAYVANADTPGTELARNVTTYDTTEDGKFVTREVTQRFERRIRLGHGKYLWAEGESPDLTETLREVGRNEVSYIATGDSHSRVERIFDAWGQEVESQRDQDLAGYLPAAELRRDIVPGAAVYDDDAEAAHAMAASRLESQQIEAEVIAPAGLDWFTRELKQGAPDAAETVAQLERIAQWTIRESSTLGLKVPLMFHPLIRPNQRWRVELDSLGWRYDMVVDRVQHTQEDGRTWTQVEGEHFVV